MSRRLEKETVFRTTPERLWQALTTGEVAAWIDPEASIDLRVGGRMTIGAAGGGEIVEIDPPRKLVVRLDIFGPNQPVMSTITIDPVPGGTRFRVVEEGYLEGESGTWAMSGSDPGWEEWWANLEQWLAKGTRCQGYEYGILNCAFGLRDPNSLQSPLYIKRVTPGGAAEKAGLQAEDDLIAWNGKPVNGPSDLWRVLWPSPPGTVVNLTLRRGGNEVSATLTLAPMKKG